jgi:hypothetical protein
LLRLDLEKRRNAITFGSQRARADQFQILNTARLLTSHSLAFGHIKFLSGSKRLATSNSFGLQIMIRPVERVLIIYQGSVINVVRCARRD